MGLYRKVIKIRAEDSPNVRLGLAQLRSGRKPTNEMVVPGVLSWADYVKRRQTWDPVKQCIGLDANFWKGEDLLLYPPDWLARAHSLATSLSGSPRYAKAMGIDPAEGGDKTCFVVLDEKGIIELISLKTVNTAVIVPRAIHLIIKYGLDPSRVCFDRGGGGIEHADLLRSRGYPVKTVAFGSPVGPEPDQVSQSEHYNVKKKVERKEEKYPYKNRRAEMYGELRLRLRPPWLQGEEEGNPLARNLSGQGFAIPAYHKELNRQLALMPLKYDDHGRMYLPPKTRKTRTKLSEKTLEEIIGHSPDEADALVIALYALRSSVKRGRAGAAW